MPTSLSALGHLVLGTLLLRPYVFAFLAVFAVAAARDLGALRMIGFLLWGFTVAFAAEYASTRIGIPFGLYHYTGETRGVELYIGNVPFFDSLSFPFLAYASFCLARRALGLTAHRRVVVLAGVLMMLLDVVIDPLAVRGDRWFLGRIFYYPDGGAYFGVPLSNFGGWLLVGWLTVGGYVAAARRGGHWVNLLRQIYSALASRPSRSARRATLRAGGQPSTYTHVRLGLPARSRLVWLATCPSAGGQTDPLPGGDLGRPGPGVGLYYGVLLFNLALTWWIGENALLGAGILVHFVVFLLLYVVGGTGRGREVSPGG